jgi:hypothetical protein
MPRLSLYRPNKTNDYRFFDRTISEMFTVGGLDIFVHKYLGPKPTADNSTTTGVNGDATQPNYAESSPLFVEDLLLGEIRDRSYDADIYRMRGVYQQQDIDFDLTQFGLFLNNDTLFITFHYNDMMDTFQRKLMSGDVLEFPNLKDWNPLNPATPPLPRFYVIQDASFASEGFSQTWLPHLWRVKATPMTNSQEYQDIVNACLDNNAIWDSGNYYPVGSVVLAGDQHYRALQGVPVGIDITDTNFWISKECDTVETEASTRPKDLAINDAILVQAEAELPLSGYDTVNFYIFPTNPDGTPADPQGPTVDSSNIDVSQTGVNADQASVTPRADGWTVGYLTGDGIAPNGLPVTPGVAFPMNPQEGQYALRLDYFPNRLFRYNGRTWIKIEENVRTDLTNGPQNNTLRSTFVNNTYTVRTVDQGNIPSRQSLSEILKPQADNGNQGGDKPANPYPGTQPGQKSS